MIIVIMLTILMIIIVTMIMMIIFILIMFLVTPPRRAEGGPTSQLQCLFLFIGLAISPLRACFQNRFLLCRPSSLPCFLLPFPWLVHFRRQGLF